jgi:hypothetical protein
MTRSPFADFLSAIGHHVLVTSSGEWFDAGPRFFLNIPFHRTISPLGGELSELLRRGRAIGVRYASPLAGSGRLSYQIVCDQRPYEIEALSPNNRSKVRRGLRRCEIERVDCRVIATQGRQAHLDTMRRQGRSRSDPRRAPEIWSRYWEAAASTEGMEAWGAFVDRKLAAYLLTVRLEDRIEFLVARSSAEHLNHYPNNALIYTVTREMLGRGGIAEVTFGLESLERVDALDQFKFAMGFRQRPLRQCVVVRPALARFLRLAGVQRAVRWQAARPTAHPSWRKLAGIIDFMEGDGKGVVPSSRVQTAH